jgi:hypothetical protein
MKCPSLVFRKKKDCHARLESDVLRLEDVPSKRIRMKTLEFLLLDEFPKKYLHHPSEIEHRMLHQKELQDIGHLMKHCFRYIEKLLKHESEKVKD